MPLFLEEQKTEAGTKKRGKKRKSNEAVTLHKVSSEEADVLMPLFPEEQKTEAGTKKRGKKRKSNANTEDYIVERILSMKTTKGKRFYLIKWNGYPDSENSWEPEDNIPNNVIHYFL
ncbi:chromo domain protein LHP1-like [Pecten maximus]|uniref:chromo domain protein LHP1-like n=1 Tax=Pecten maximus TaxID=6579 RepID=UPI001458851B|nr:chromo domain protein LHP1-like [Pecten maximus]